MASHEEDPVLEARRREMVSEVLNRSVGGQPIGLPRRKVSLSGARMRTLLLPAFAIVIFLNFGSRAGAPLGVHAAFIPSETGESFAGARHFGEAHSPVGDEAIRLSPGDCVGTRSGSPSTLVLGDGRLELEPGSRAVVASLMPPRARLFGGDARVTGRLRVVTAMGLVDLDEGEVLLHLDEAGLEVRLINGKGRLTAPGGVTELVPGALTASR